MSHYGALSSAFTQELEADKAARNGPYFFVNYGSGIVRFKREDESDL